MAWKSKDGQPFTNRMSMKMHDASMGDKQGPPAKMAMQEAPQPMGGQDAGQDQQPQITDDPAAMRLVDQLQKMGYTPDDVAGAMSDMGGDDDQGQGGGGQEATAAAPLQIPGLR